jgi:NAD(P)-dependent dehydrogenase (short-subunit alcohol dehydrogenase family)
MSFTKAYGVTKEIVEAGIPLRRMGVPEDTVEMVGFLVSDRAVWMTGSYFTVRTDWFHSPLRVRSRPVWSSVAR